jgi:hypothetical protein
MSKKPGGNTDLSEKPARKTGSEPPDARIMGDQA